MSLSNENQNINQKLVDAILTLGIRNLFKLKKGN